MATSDVSNKPGGFIANFNKAPYIGISTFIVVILMQGLGHTVMILMELLLGHEYVYQSATFMGLVGAYLWYIGLTNPSAIKQTWLGFFAGTLVWTGWVEFSFVYYADFLSVPDLCNEGVANIGLACADGESATNNEYMVMMSSLGVLIGTLVFFFLNKDTKCNFFRWFHRNLNMKLGKPSSGAGRNLCTITAIYTIYIIWFFYVALLLIYDPQILGETHPVTYGLFLANTAWGLFLMSRLMRFSRMDAAIRYGIAAAIIMWNSIELLGRWNFFTEIWVHPMDYALEMGLVFGAIVIFAGVSMMVPDRKRPPEEVA